MIETIVPTILGIFTLALTSHECLQLPLLCPSKVAITSAGSVIYWSDSNNNTLVTQSLFNEASIPLRDVPYNVYLGVEYDINSVRKTKLDQNSTWMNIEETTSLLSSQGATPFYVSHTFQLGTDGKTLSYTINSEASTPKIDVKYTYQRGEDDINTNDSDHKKHDIDGVIKSTDRLHMNHIDTTFTTTSKITSTVTTAPPTAYNLNVVDAWELIDPNFQNNAMMISLQGLANRDHPNLYLTYPKNWSFSYTSAVRDYVEKSKYVTFQTLNQPSDALKQFSSFFQKYVVWDPLVRDTLVVAYTIAGIENAIVVTDEMLPSILKEHPTISMAANLSTIYQKNTSIEIFSWARDQYKKDTNSSMLVWMGGVCPDKMQPGIADWGVKNKAFFVELNTVNDPSNEEYSFADSIVGTLTDMETGAPPMVVGWHTYCGDYEHTFTTLVSKHGGRVHGLDTNPNLSFMSTLSLRDGYVYHNKHSPPLTKKRKDELLNKVIITLVQTDGLGLGAWAKGGRGTLPYVWEVTLPDLEIQPVLLSMFYEQATANDTFVGALGGPGYTYPKAVPKDLLPLRLEFAQKSMKTLDLNHFVIFDASETHGEHTVTGNTCLNEDVVDVYFKSMTDTIGFLNGYAPSFSFQHDEGSGTTRGNRSLVSFDYYLDPERSVNDAITDINALATLNTKRPYYLAIHVREFSTVGKVIDIVNGLDSNVFEITPVDDFFAMANEIPTWQDKMT
jgi:hypothetical protein